MDKYYMKARATSANEDKFSSVLEQMDNAAREGKYSINLDVERDLKMQQATTADLYNLCKFLELKGYDVCYIYKDYANDLIQSVTVGWE